jgi:hypothetical protein
MQLCSTNLSDLKFRPAHATFHSFDDQASFEFANGSDDDEHGATQRAGGVDVFAETD